MAFGFGEALGLGSAALGLFGASKQASGVKAASAQANALSREAMAQQQAAMDQYRGDMQPYAQAGLNALAPQQALLGLSGQEAADTAMQGFQASPGYDWQMSQGLKAVDTGAAARGLLRSGSTLQAEQNFGSNLANQEFGTYYNRLAGMVQSGQQASAGVGQASLQSAGQQTASLNNQAQTATSAATAQGSIYGNATSALGNLGNQYLQNSMYQQRVNQLAPPPSLFAGTSKPQGGGW